MNDRPDIHTLTGAYAVDALPDDERDVFEHHLVVCDACAQEVAELQATASHLGAASYEAPPPALRARVMAEIDATRQERPAGLADAADELGARRGRASRLGTGWFTNLAVAAAAVLVVAVAGLSVTIANLSDRMEQVEAASSQMTDVLAAADATVVSVEGPEGGFGRLVASPTLGEAVFLADAMESAPHEHTYELWVIDDEGATPAGLFDTDDDGRAMQIMTGDFANAAAIGVTIEPTGGSPEPTTEPVMVFELS
jgi:anti-sigma-K factor RskA